jgi:hypothetical protein
MYYINKNKGRPPASVKTLLYINTNLDKLRLPKVLKRLELNAIDNVNFGVVS